VKVKSHPHMRFLPTHPHSISAAHIRILPVATSADPHIRFLPIAVLMVYVFLGPCGGKTTGQARLCSFFEHLGWKVCLLLFLCFREILELEKLNVNVLVSPVVLGC